MAPAANRQTNRPSRRPSKLWEVDSGLLCSIVGTCLSFADLRKIASKVNLSLESGASEHAIHSTFVHLAMKANAASRRMQKRLDRKYQVAVRRFSKAKDLEQIRNLWQKSVEEGDIPGPYWALMTHAMVDEKLRNKAYGHVHMLSHMIGAANRADVRYLRNLEHQMEGIEKKRVRERTAVAKKFQSLETRNRVLEEENAALKPLLNKLAEAQNMIAEHLDKGGVRRMMEKNEKLEQRLIVADARANDLLDKLTSKEAQLAHLADTKRRLQKDIQAIDRERHALEHDVLALLATNKPCSEANEANSTIAKSLCGRSILYVGGRSNLVQHYRELVKRYGGQFLHHDGGQEDNSNRLPAMLHRADVVCCPVDCISHDACLRLKNDCKRHNKGYVMIRSSGLSSLAVEIQNIAKSSPCEAGKGQVVWST